MTDYEILQLKPNFYLVRWLQSPKIGAASETGFLETLRRMLDEAPEPLYLISDLRFGRISNALILRELGKLTQHPKFAGSTAFTKDPVTNLMVAVFKQYAQRVQNGESHETWETPEEAIAYLTRLAPGLTEDVDWSILLPVT